jgi:hypothetical protein
MRVRHYAQGKFYTIQCPEGTRIVRRKDQPADGEAVQDAHMIVPLNGQEVRIPADPSELLAMLAETGHFGVSLVGEPVSDERLSGVACPKCGETDVTWLQLRDGSEAVRCDYSGTEFGLPVLIASQDTSFRRAGG